MKYAELIAPIENDRHCGENIRNNTLHREAYFRIKDARGMARATERTVLPGENIGLSPLWQEVSNLGLRILSSQSKDIEVLAWLTEAQLRLDGYFGLKEMYAVTVSLLEQYFDELHSIGDDDDEEKFAPLAGLNGVGSEGTIIQAIRLTSLVPGGKFGQHTLWDFQVSQRPGEERRREMLENALADLNVAQIKQHLSLVTDCVRLFDRMTEILVERCGERAPPSSNTRNVLQEAAAALRFLGHVPDLDAVRDDTDLASSDLGQSMPQSVDAKQPVLGQTPRSADQIASREDAFEILLSIARYFKKVEPHSPISMSIETLVRRGRMDFSELLAELMPDTHQRQAVLTAAGIRSTADTS